MALLLPSTEYDSIRELLGLTLTELAVTVIERLPFLPAAEAEVKRQVPTYAGIIAAAGDNRDCLYSAIVYLTAAKLCTRQLNLTRAGERIGDFAAGQIDWEALRASLLAEATAQLRAISTITRAAPSSLIVAGVSRTARAEIEVTGDAEFDNY